MVENVSPEGYKVVAIEVASTTFSDLGKKVGLGLVVRWVLLLVDPSSNLGEVVLDGPLV